MTTIINTPATPPGAGENSNNQIGNILGIVLILFLLVGGYFAFAYGLPALRQMRVSTTPQINVPNKIDVNVHQN